MAVSCILAYGGIDELPVRVPNCYANQGLTDKLVDEKLQILSEPTLKFFKSEPNINVIDFRKAGAVAKAIQSRLALKVIGKTDAGLTLNNKRGQQSYSCHGKSADHSATRQYHMTPHDNNTETRKVSVRQAKECSKDSTRKASCTSRSHIVVNLEDELELIEEHNSGMGSTSRTAGDLSVKCTLQDAEHYNKIDLKMFEILP